MESMRMKDIVPQTAWYLQIGDIKKKMNTCAADLSL
jgi:hypothetical protein